MRRSAWVLLASLVVLGSLASAGPVAAECFPPPDDFPETPYVFVATVSSVSRVTALSLPDGAPFDWRIEFAVGRVYAGDVPSRVIANGWDVGCGFTGIRVDEGEELLIAAEKLDATDPRLVLGEVLIWRRQGDNWSFYGEALHDGTLGYPVAAIEADTRREILSVVRVASLPDTSTEPVTGSRNDELAIIALLTVLAAVAASSRVLLRRA